MEFYYSRCQQWKNAISTQQGIIDTYEVTERKLLGSIEDHKRIKAALQLALISTAVVMAGSIVAIPLVRHLVAQVPVRRFCDCLWLYYRLIRAALKG